MIGADIGGDGGRPGGEVVTVGFWSNFYGELEIGVPAMARWSWVGGDIDSYRPMTLSAR